jgi:hypothetical protein
MPHSVFAATKQTGTDAAKFDRDSAGGAAICTATIDRSLWLSGRGVSS